MEGLSITNRVLFSIFFIVPFLGFSVRTVLGHSYIVEESPLPNSFHETPPTEVKISFHSQVEKNFSITIFDENKKKVTSGFASISDNQKEITLNLPNLVGGNYKVEYYVISSNDGHPIHGSYQFQVASNNSITKDHQINEEVIKDVSKQRLHNHSRWSEVTALELLNYSLRATYTVGLVLLIGWVIWWRIIQNYSLEVKQKYLFWGMIFQMIHLVGLISVIGIQLDIFANNGLLVILDFPFESPFGILWLISLLISLIGFLFLWKNQWFDIFCLVVIMTTKILTGHAKEFEPTFLLVIADMIHLLTASLWAAGLSFMIIFWRKQRVYVKSFLPVFSKTAIISFVTLTITGSYMAIMYLHPFRLQLTNWGLLFLLKLFLVFLIIFTGVKIWSKSKNTKISELGNWMKIDFLFMILLIIVISILTYLNPQP